MSDQPFLVSVRRARERANATLERLAKRVMLTLDVFDIYSETAIDTSTWSVLVALRPTDPQPESGSRMLDDAFNIVLDGLGAGPLNVALVPPTYVSDRLHHAVQNVFRHVVSLDDNDAITAISRDYTINAFRISNFVYHSRILTLPQFEKKYILKDNDSEERSL